MTRSRKTSKRHILYFNNLNDIESDVILINDVYKRIKERKIRQLKQENIPYKEISGQGLCVEYNASLTDIRAIFNMTDEEKKSVDELFLRLEIIDNPNYIPKKLP